MHYTDAIAQLRALGFEAHKMGLTIRITHKAKDDFIKRFAILDDGNLINRFDIWFDDLKKQLIPKLTIDDLKRGTPVRRKDTPDRVYVITANFGDRATAVFTADITNADEWEIVQ